jgi:hypothetical protein
MAERAAASDANLVNLLTLELHRGEAEAIALALEIKADWLLMDEREGRAVARQLGLQVTGVLGVLLRGKKMAPRSHQARTRRSARQGPFLHRPRSRTGRSFAGGRVGVELYEMLMVAPGAGTHMIPAVSIS